MIGSGEFLEQKLIRAVSLVHKGQSQVLGGQFQHAEFPKESATGWGIRVAKGVAMSLRISPNSIADCKRRGRLLGQIERRGETSERLWASF